MNPNPEAPPNQPLYKLARAAQSTADWHEKLTKHDSHRGTNRNVYLLRDRIFGKSERSAFHGIVGGTPRYDAREKVYVQTPQGLLPIDRWHELEREKTVNRRTIKRRRKNRLARDSRRAQRRACKGRQNTKTRR